MMRGGEWAVVALVACVLIYWGCLFHWQRNRVLPAMREILNVLDRVVSLEQMDRAHQDGSFRQWYRSLVARYGQRAVDRAMSNIEDGGEPRRR
jgi:hypothetical protein